MDIVNVVLSKKNDIGDESNSVNCIKILLLESKNCLRVILVCCAASCCCEGGGLDF